MTELHPHLPKPPSASRLSARTAAILLVFTVMFTAFMAMTYSSTKSRIAASAEEEKLRLIGEVLPVNLYDNVLLRDSVELEPTPDLGLERKSKVFRARKNGQPVALVLEAAAPDGYSGRIGLIVAMRADGSIVAVRVTEHKETPGLGDYIDIRKDKHKDRPWINQFAGQGLDKISFTEWRVKKDGGRFDQVSGATISARAVTNALGRALRYAAENSARLFDATTPAAPAKDK